MSSIAATGSAAHSASEARLRKTGLIIPTCNAARFWGRLQEALGRQGIEKSHVLIVDSSSTDSTPRLAKRAGYRLKTVSQEDFRHGATRQMAAECLPWAETLLYLTQDAIPCGENSISNLLSAFDDPQVGAAYGRQLPRAEAGPIERHARLFNYPPVSDVRSYACRTRLGVKAAFFSNSFAAYRRSALEEVGGFPLDTIVSEEVTVVARMLLAGWKVAYQADATSVHSHAFTMREEFSRYFDIGIHRGREGKLLRQFGDAGGEGRAFVVSEIRFLLKNQPSLIPVAVLRDISKWCAYRLGLHEKHLPFQLKRELSGQPNFWLDEQIKRKRYPSPEYQELNQPKERLSGSQ